MYKKLDHLGNLFDRVVCLPLFESIHDCCLPNLVQSAGIERLSIAKDGTWDDRSELNSTIAVVAICISGLENQWDISILESTGRIIKENELEPD